MYEELYKKGEPSDLSNLSNEAIVNSLDHEERGFDELKKTIQQHRSVQDDIRKFHLIWGEIRDISEVTGLSIPVASTATINGLMCVEYMDGTYGRVIFNAVDLENTAKLTEVRTWARETATIESYFLTMTLVFVWFIISLLIQ